MSNYKFETLQLHVGQEQPDPATDARAVPIYQTTSYVFRNSAHAAARFGLADAGNIYGRLTNSTQDVLEKRIAASRGRRGCAGDCFRRGCHHLRHSGPGSAPASHIVAQKTIYGGTYNLLAHTLPPVRHLHHVRGRPRPGRGGKRHPGQHQGHLPGDPGQPQQLTSPTLTPSPPSPTSTACPWSSTTPSAPPT